MARTARRGKLTDVLIERLTPRPDGREAIVRDGVIPGFLIRCGRRKKSFEIRIERKGRQKVFKTLGAWPGVNCFISEILLPCADSNVANFVRLIARPKEPGLTGTASPTPSTQGAKGQLSKVLLTKAA